MAYQTCFFGLIAAFVGYILIVVVFGAAFDMAKYEPIDCLLTIISFGSLGGAIYFFLAGYWNTALLSITVYLLMAIAWFIYEN